MNRRAAWQGGEHLLQSSEARKIDASIVLGLSSVAVGLLATIPMMMLASVFGLGAVTDAYFVALQLVRSITKILRFGTLQKIYTALFTPRIQHDSLANLKKPVSNLFNLCVVIVGPLVLLLTVLSPKMIELLAPGFSTSSKEMAAALLQLLFCLIMYDALVSLFVGILHSCQRFSFVAVSSVVPAGVVAIAAVVGLPRLGIYALVWGNLLGSAVHVLLLCFAMFRLGFRFVPVLTLSEPDLRTVGKRIRPFYFSGLVLEARRLFVLLVLGSTLPPGGVSALVMATRIVGYVADHAFRPVMTVAYPSLVKRACESVERMEQYMVRVLRMSHYLFFPVLVFLVVFSEEVVRVLFYRGAFRPESVADVTVALMILTVGLFPRAVEGVLNSTMFALGHTGWLNLFNILSQLGVAVLSVLLLPFGVAGLAVANATIKLQEVLLELIYLRRHMAVWRIIAGGVSVKIVCLGVAVGVMAYTFRWLMWEPPDPGWMQAIYLILLSLPAGILYLALSRCLRLPEFMMISAYLWSWLGGERWKPWMNWARVLGLRE